MFLTIAPPPPPSRPTLQLLYSWNLVTTSLVQIGALGRGEAEAGGKRLSESGGEVLKAFYFEENAYLQKSSYPPRLNGRFAKICLPFSHV